MGNGEGELTCPNCGFVHDYVRGRCPRCGLQNIPEGKPPSGCTRLGIGCFFFPIGAIGSCVATYLFNDSPVGGFLGSANASLVAALVGGVLAVWAIDNYLMGSAAKNAAAREKQDAAIRAEHQQKQGVGSEITAVNETEEPPANKETL